MTDLAQHELRDLNTISATASATYHAGQRTQATIRDLTEDPVANAVSNIYQWAGRPGEASAHERKVRQLLDGIVERQKEVRTLLQALNRELNAAVSVADDARARRRSSKYGTTLNV